MNLQERHQSGRVTVIARIRAKAGLEETVLQEMSKLLSPTRSEPGCINYDLHVSSSDPTHFMFHENWESESDLARHLQSPHLKAWLERAPQFLALPVEIERWSRVE
jgi:quinol monooxygenase YgiN